MPADSHGEEAGAATPLRAPCALGPLALRVPVPAGMVLAAAPETCVLADEEREGSVLVLTAFGPEDPRTPQLRQRPDAVVGDLALLRSPRRVASATTRLLGRGVPATGWRADVPPFGRRDVMSFAADALVAEGLYAVLALVVTPPGDVEARRSLLALAATIEGPRPPR